MSPLSSVELAAAVPEPVRGNMLRYFLQIRSSGDSPSPVEESGGHPSASGFDHEELVSGLHRLLHQHDCEGCVELMTRLHARKVSFVIVSHRLAHLRDRLIRQAMQARDLDAIGAFIAFFDGIEGALARVYLSGYLLELEHRNGVRLRHIAALAEKNLLLHFEKHLDWMRQLTAAVAARDRHAMPEAHHECCEFGKWLHGEGARLVRDRSHYTHLVELHAAMHGLVPEIGRFIGQSDDSRPLYALLKKAENYSLDMGNEISLLNSMVIMIHYNKDPLTGALTRRSLERVMLNQLEISRATETPFCLLMCDLDHFKEINDRHGHTVGDRAIARFAGALRQHLRQSDLIFRFGGDEFLLLLPATAYAQGLEVAEKLRVAVEAGAADSETPEMRASFGLLEIDGGHTTFIDGELVGSLIQECDRRLYLAKHRGRNQVA